MTATAAPSPVQGGLFSISGRMWLILLMVQLSNMLFGMTMTLANLVLPQMRGTLSATQDEISWVITLNLVATAVATPLTGWISSRVGWRNMMFFTVLGFTISSFLCGIANSLETLDHGPRGPRCLRRADHAHGAGHPARDLSASPAADGAGDVGHRRRIRPCRRAHTRRGGNRGIQLARGLLHDRAAGHSGHGVHLVRPGRSHVAPNGPASIGWASWRYR